MSLVGPYLNNISTKKPSEKMTKIQEAEHRIRFIERNKYLKSIGLPKESYQQYLDFIYGRQPKSTKIKAKSNNSRKLPTYDVNRIKEIRQHESIKEITIGACGTKESQFYTGDKIIGISQMAKSNSVPVFNQEAIVEIARMRR